MDITPLRWLDPPAGPAIELLDQTRLPAEETYLTCTDVPQLVDAIRRLAVRGAPMLGVAAAYGVALAAARGDDVPAAASAISAARPTAANLAWGEGTAFAVILAAHRAGRLARLWIDETRPLLQGARLTAWEAARANLPHTLLADNAAAALMASGQVDLVLTGADRIAADGSVANKVGTYGLAVLARQHGVPFAVVAPVSTIDFETPA